MNINLKNAVAVIALLTSTSAIARDDQNMYPIEEALNAPAAKEKLDTEIRLFFGKKTPANIATRLGEWKTNKKTNAFNKSDKEACEWAFLSAVLELQERARKEGGNAVIDIASNYKNNETTSETEYMCGNGALMAGVAFKGTVVKLK